MTMTYDRTIGDIDEKRNAYVGVEVYEYKDYPPYERLHGDFVKYLGSPDDLDLPDDTPCQLIEMGEEEYNQVMNCNCDITDDFGELYGDKDGKMLVVMLQHNSTIWQVFDPDC